MEIGNWKKIIQVKKKSPICTGALDLRVLVNQERTIFKLTLVKKERFCKCCGTDLFKEKETPLVIEFFDKPNISSGLEGSLSVFEAELLFMIFKQDKIPYDYARYHECIAGKRFINNIKEVSIDGTVLFRH